MSWLGVPSTTAPTPTPPPAAYTLPSSIPADCSRDTSADLNTWLASVPDNSTATFPANGCFTGAQTIYLIDRHGLTIDGHGSTFRITSQGNTKTAFRAGWNRTGGNWMLLRGDHITLRNINAVGSFPLAGQPISLANESAQAGYAEYMSNFGVYGTSYATIQNSSGSAPWGDTLTTGAPLYVDNNTSPVVYTSHLLVDHLTSSSPSRDCFALTSGQTMTVQHSSCAHAWYGGSDEEIDNSSQPLTGVSLLSNSWSDYNLFAVAIPVAGPNVGTFTIKGNLFGSSMHNVCAAAVIVGGYHYGTIANVVTDYNDFTSPSDATLVSYQDVSGGEVQHNKLTATSPQGCGTASGPAPLVSVTHSLNVTVSDNGTGAVGAAGYGSTGF